MNTLENNDVDAMAPNNGGSLKRQILTIAITAAIAITAGCGGGGGGGGGGNPAPGQTNAPITTAPTTIGNALVGVGTTNVLAPDPNNANAFVTTARPDLAGFSLYTFDADTIVDPMAQAPGLSTCTDITCVTNWPPLLADPNAVATLPYTIITRDDGTMQWAIRGKPLYYFFNDQMPADIAGDAVGNIWRIATTAPVLTDRVADPANSSYLVSSGSALTYVPSAPNSTTYVPQRITTDRLSLYTFDLDTPGATQCQPNIDPTCLTNWPPLMADPGDVATAPYSLVDLPIDLQGNTAKQWALNGKPLYFFITDMVEGDINGVGKPNWRLARPQDAQQVMNAVNTTITPNSQLGSMLAGSGRLTTLLPDPNGTPGTDFVVTPVTYDNVSLYTFATDTPGVLANNTQAVSNCTGNCLVNWPPLLAGPNADPQPPFSLLPVNTTGITGADGQMMWAVNGKPLYFFIGDVTNGVATPNLTNGENVNGGGFWNVARTAPVRVANNQTQGDLLVSDGPQVDITGQPILPNPAVPAQVQGLGYTLYTFDNDTTPNVSTCIDGCLVKWPALYASPTAVGVGDYTVIARPANTDGTPGGFQWAYKGKPLYYYIGDQAANIRDSNAGQPADPAAAGGIPSNTDTGDATGGAVANWTIARP